MARTKRKIELTTEQKIEEITASIIKTENEIIETRERLANLEEQNKMLNNQLRQEKINLLLETINEKDISLDKAREIINNING